jgi:hypothetical protein
MFLFSALNLIALSQESIIKIKNTCVAISGKTVNSCYHQDITQFNDLVTKLAGLKPGMDSTLYFLDLEPDFSGERSLPFSYDQSAGTFSVSNEVGYSYYYNELGNIQLDQILFKCPVGITVSNKNINYACVDMVQETITFTVRDAIAGRDIGQNRDNVRLLFIFKFKGIVPLHETSSPVLKAGDYCLITELRKVIVYNSSTGNSWVTYQ